MNERSFGKSNKKTYLRTYKLIVVGKMLAPKSGRSIFQPNANKKWIADLADLASILLFVEFLNAEKGQKWAKKALFVSFFARSITSKVAS